MTDAAKLLVGIRRSGDLAPLHLVHSIAGELTWLPLLARRLDERRPLYGFAAPGSILSFPACERLEDLAAVYLAAVRTAQPRGPYLFGGYSFGGLVAYEMARQALAAGDRVQGLVLIDSYTPDAASMQALMQWAKRGLLIQAMANLLALEWRGSAVLGPGALPAGDPQGQIDVATRELLAHCRVPHSYDALQTVIEKCQQVTEVHMAMLAAYRATAPAPLDALLLHNTQGFIGAANVLRLPDLGAAAAPGHHGWQRYLCDAPQPAAIAAEHFLMMRPPALDEVARCVQAYCAARTPAGSPTFGGNPEAAREVPSERTLR